MGERHIAVRGAIALESARTPGNFYAIHPFRPLVAGKKNRGPLIWGHWDNHKIKHPELVIAVRLDVKDQYLKMIKE